VKWQKIIAEITRDSDNHSHKKPRQLIFFAQFALMPGKIAQCTPTALPTKRPYDAMTCGGTDPFPTAGLFFGEGVCQFPKGGQQPRAVRPELPVLGGTDGGTKTEADGRCM